VLPAVEQRSIPAASVLREARPAALEDGRLVLEFAPNADFHRRLAEDSYAAILREALYEVTGRRLVLVFELGDAPHEAAEEDDRPLGEEELMAMLKDRFDATEVEDR
jgi:hypothetical protein